VGQPELKEVLATPQLRQLRQRIVLRYEIQPLDAEDTRSYVEERLRLAGDSGTGIFKKGALDEIYRVTGGIPRLINIVCDSALLLGFAREQAVMGRDAIREVSRDLDLDGARKGSRLDGEARRSKRRFSLFR
jgi:general secretion pathway protein A